MAEILRINESAPAPVTPALPHNIEAEAALLGALMIDNRLVEDVQLKLRSDHYFEPLHGRIYDAILRMTDKNMVANPVTLRPMFEADEAMKFGIVDKVFETRPEGEEPSDEKGSGGAPE